MRKVRLGGAAGALWLALACVVAPTAAAHPLLDEARSQADEAQFQQALLTLARAESESQLTRDDLIALYLQRALVHFALQIPGAMLADLERVAALAPHLELDASIPPGVREAFPSGEPLRLRVRADASPERVRLTASAEGMRTDMVQQVVVSGRIRGEAWQRGMAGELELEGAPGDPVDYHAIALGPGGSELAHGGSEDDPMHLSLPQRPVIEPSTTGEEDEGSSATPWVIGGALAALAAIVLVALAAGGESDRTQIAGPEVMR